MSPLISRLEHITTAKCSILNFIYAKSPFIYPYKIHISESLYC